MPGLELHTLNHTETEAAQRAGTGAIAGRLPVHVTEKSPVTTGDFSYEDLGQDLLLRAIEVGQDAESRAVTVISDYLPSIESQEALLAELAGIELFEEFLDGAKISPLTGCIMNPGEWNNQNGYTRKKSKITKELGLGSWSEMHYAAHYLYHLATTGTLPNKEERRQKRVDHKCRNAHCWSPSHTRRVEPRENHRLMNDAKKLEPVIIGGQLVYLGDLLNDLPWLRHTIITNEDEVPQHVISTRMGPFALRLAAPEAFIVYGESLSCEIYDSLRPSSKSNYVAPSRAKKFKPIEGHKDLFPKTKYRKKKPLDKIKAQKEAYEREMRY